MQKLGKLTNQTDCWKQEKLLKSM